MTTSLASSRNGRLTLRLSILGGLAVCVLLGAFAGARAVGEEPAEKPKAIVLFDGKTLDGWKKTDFYGAKDVDVRVADGAIVLPLGKSMTGVTTTRTDLPKTNYELTYEAMRTEGVDFFGAATFPVGGSFLSFVNGGWGGHVTGLSSLDGADASENETTYSHAYNNKTWYRFRIRVTDQAVRCAIDDKEIIAVDVTNRHLSTRVQVRASQPLGFATWETAGAVRNIQIRPLTAAEVAAAKVVEP
ncbi:3-keto-disaccharide hydrolase [Paludisphaera borealis]|uniref:3-keto-alpha-glucoside-1,2-lyase/3-keto-2-hydroxy-glucal hydratase domain-containing protein n=1 Tax=Paludisphaera borealis TaxID=1387353 RepID=A0A1U7CPE2_9BACT|nr:DUF1080 domain-containing protein [Paludisphaera borealis]APW60802.1 hypothetical protein BSF38_02291 [Paludisphaera borealis]